ncbi:MAG: DUF5698 domain-containing protein [Planctomycetota bacterium]
MPAEWYDAFADLSSGFTLWDLLGAFLIFLARILDVAIGTMRGIYTMRGYRKMATLLGFFESLIFIVALSGVLHGELNLPRILAYAAGFAGGIYVGISIEAFIGSGWQVVRVIARDYPELDEAVRAAGWAVTEVPAEGRDGPTKILLIVSRRRRVKKLIELVNAEAPGAFITIDGTGRVIGGMTSPMSATAIRK